MFKTLLRQIGQYRTATILTPVFIMLEVVMDVLIPYVTSWLIDRGINAGDLSAVYRYGGLMLVMAFISLAMGILGGRYVAKASTGFAANLRKAMYRNIQRFAFSDIDKYSTSGLVTRMTTDVSNLQNAFQMVLRTSIRAPFMLLFSIVICFVISPRMSLIFVIATAVLAVMLTFIIRRVSATMAQVFKQYDQVNAVVQENVSAIRVVKAFVREDHENSKFDGAATTLYRLYMKAETLMAVNHPVMNLVVFGCIIAISWFGAQFVVAGQLTTGQLTSLFTYVMSILMSLMMLSMIFVQVTLSLASGKRVAEVINEVPDIVNPSPADPNIPDGRIDFNHVSFAYKGGSGEYALHDIDLHIASGETLGVIGGTGSGKSSLITLISRLYDTTRGSVAVGGKDVRTLDLTALRDAVAVVLQKNVLFSGTIIDNLRWGNPEATLDECR
ncbi:MAG: ABC transporter ATP-binding protein, partial [Muribaculaceae bacterium]|nr:ABC transporter ATP-binding protein [Muribaculaceae bacterium]